MNPSRAILETLLAVSVCCGQQIAAWQFNGCYIQTPAPFTVDTLVLVKIFHADDYFEAKGTVIYVKATSGTHRDSCR